MQNVLKVLAPNCRSKSQRPDHGRAGTGKELNSPAIHEHSRAAKEPFLKLQLCGFGRTPFLEVSCSGHENGGPAPEVVGLP